MHGTQCQALINEGMEKKKTLPRTVLFKLRDPCLTVSEIIREHVK